MGAAPLRDDDHIKGLGRAAGERDPGFVRTIVDRRELVVEPILRAVLRTLVEQPREVAAKDFHLRSRTVAARIANGKSRRLAPVLVDPDRPLLPGPMLERCGLKLEATDHLAPDSPHVDILSAIAKRRCPFDHHDLAAFPGQDRRSGIAGDAGAGDEDASVHESLLCAINRRSDLRVPPS